LKARFFQIAQSLLFKQVLRPFPPGLEELAQPQARSQRDQGHDLKPRLAWGHPPGLARRSEKAMKVSLKTILFCTYRSIDVVVRLQLVFVNHIVIITELFPSILVLKVSLLMPRLFIMLHHLHPSLLVLSPFLSAITIFYRTYPHLFVPLMLHHLLLLLPLKHHGIWLHVYHDYIGSK
jgi:hypothetical protein